MEPIRRRGALAVALCLLPFCALLEAGPAPGRVESISPSAGRPGEPITITGHGFGSKNARVMVGNLDAAIAKATGSTIVFTVPANALPGPTQVTVTNPGGQGSGIAFTVLGTGPQAAGQDHARARSVVVSTLGGVVATTSAAGVVFSLAVPPGAVGTDMLITLTPVTALVGLPFSGAGHVGVRMQPSGLHFDRVATLTVSPPAGTDTSRLFGFAFDDNGEHFEVLPARIDGGSFSLPIAHFSTAGLGQGTLADFEQEVAPLLNALPASLPPALVTPLVNHLMEWLLQFGTDVCSQTALCRQVFDTALQSLTFHRDQACGQAMSLVQQGEIFLARAAIEAVLRLTVSVVTTSSDAEALGLDGFDQTVDLGCVATTLRGAMDAARQQALDDPRAGPILLILDLTADAAAVGLDEVEQHGRAAIVEVLETIRGMGASLCESDADAGEIMLDMVRNNLTGLTLDQVSPDLATRYYEAWAGCRIRIVPAAATITRGRQLQFTGSIIGLPAGLSWQVESPSGNGSIDVESGLYAAGRLDSTFGVVATSTADPFRFKRATVTVVQITVAVTPAAPTVQAGGSVQFAAAVANTPNTGVQWSATGGTVDASGRFTAGSQPGTFFVRATSLEDPLEFGETPVKVTAAATGLVGELSWVLELNGASSQRNTLAADVIFKDGGFTALGTFSFVETVQFECGPRVFRYEGAVAGAAPTSGNLTTTFNLGFSLVGTFTDTVCGELMREEPYSASGAAGMTGTSVVVNGQIVEIDFSFSETYNFPGYAGFYTQTGLLRKP